MTKTVGLLCIALGAAATAYLLAPRAPGLPEPPTSAPESPAGGVVPYRGLAVQVHSGYQPVATFEPLLREVAALGANAVLFTTPGYMEHARSQSIYIDARKVPAPADFQELIRRATGLGLRVFLMPIVLLRNPRGNEWRGQIEPPDWEDWWAQYTEFVLYFADIARDDRLLEAQLHQGAAGEINAQPQRCAKAGHRDDHRDDAGQDDHRRDGEVEVTSLDNVKH